MPDVERVRAWIATALQLLGGAAVVVAAIAWAVRRYVDHRLEAKMAAYRSDLDKQAERLRFELQREMLKAQLETGRVYEVAPKLLVKAKKAYGAVSSVMGLSFAPDWSEYDRADLERALGDRDVFPAPILSKRRRKLLEAWEGESPGLAREAREEVRALFFQQQVGRAQSLATRAHNYAVLSSVLLPADLAKVALETTAELVGVSIEVWTVLVDHAGDVRETHKRLTALGPRIEELERRIRAVLAPAAAATEAPEPVSGSR